MSDPRSTPPNGTPWGGPDPRQGAQHQPEPTGSRAHPHTPYPEQPYPEQQYPDPRYHPAQQYPRHADRNTGPQPVPYDAVVGQHPVPVDEAYPPTRRNVPRKPLPEPPEGLAVGAVVAACCLLFVELAELAILLVVGDHGEPGPGIGLARFDPNRDTVTALFALAAYLVTCAWLRACRKFAVAANPTARFARGPAWTWLGWCVPVAFFWIPYQVVRDIRGAVVRGGPRRVSLGLWWTFWLLAGLRLASSSSQELEVVLRLVAVLALTVALVQWIRIVREVTRAQEEAAGLT